MTRRVTCDPARYARVRELVEAAGSDVVINMSTGGGAGSTSDEERMAPVALGAGNRLLRLRLRQFRRARLRQLADLPARTGRAHANVRRQAGDRVLRAWAHLERPAPDR